ncbi:MFS transporter [Streptomyces sp. M2CJ-2]|uniref:MFS transporter n=1 Tax=Streptomyces sp. M2CJ-2 TaxID=2803948 RepID=UPI001925FFDC|nr:MFS transporter [Streptomyces sp. M2CJ-2]MBL3668031.1 MFS transporter [Streptomyces sp. M2CJ-2]
MKNLATEPTPTSESAALSPPAAASPRSTFKVIRAAVLGTVVEYYDFGIYGYMATLIATHFFVESDPNTALLSTFAAFAVAFFLRAPGGVLFGHVGDKYGRKKALTWTILLMSVATAGIGLIPSYATLGLWATCLLVLCRCLQGFAAGGELSGANAFVSEHAPAHRRAFHTSFVNTGTYLGSLFASLVALVLTVSVSEEIVRAWAWRIPFILSLFIGVIGLYIRSQLPETEQFEAVQDSETVEVAKYPIAEVFAQAWRQIVLVIFLGALIVGGYYVAGVYAASYLQTEGGHSADFAFMSTCLAMVAAVISLPVAGYAGDRIGRRPVFFLGSGVTAVIALPAFMLMREGSPVSAVLAQCSLTFFIGLVNGVSFATYAEIFRARYRYSGIAMSNNVTNMLLGGTAPFIATLLINVTGNNLAPAGYIIVTALMTFGATFFLKETRGKELEL